MRQLLLTQPQSAAGREDVLSESLWLYIIGVVTKAGDYHEQEPGRR